MAWPKGHAVCGTASLLGTHGRAHPGPSYGTGDSGPGTCRHQATLTVDDKVVGHHGAGPSWELDDGSGITGKAVANAPGTNANDIPWLKLEVASHTGSGGKLSDVTTVQRINTVGGVLKDSCDRQGAGRGMPYAADYVFWKKS